VSADIQDFILTFQDGRSRTVRVGYVRVSSVDQNTVRQLDGIAVERVFTDKASGKDTLRPKLDEMLAFVLDGDTVIVHSMDRLARNLDDLRRVVRSLTGKGVRVEFIKESLGFTGDDSPMATLLLSVMGAFAEFERALILERQREGIAAARHGPVLKGHFGGSGPAPVQHYGSLLDGGVPEPAPTLRRGKRETTSGQPHETLTNEQKPDSPPIRRRDRRGLQDRQPAYGRQYDHLLSPRIGHIERSSIRDARSAVANRNHPHTRNRPTNLNHPPTSQHL
jgi:DNA invertase Pin-like site-specific DNA recombinase